MTNEAQRPLPDDGGGEDREISVLLVDDHPVVRSGLRAMLDTTGITVVGEASNGRDAIDQVGTLHPDVVLMDVRMPDMDGLAATRLIKRENSAVSVIMLTSFESRDYLRTAMEAGAAGYLLKGMSRRVLIDSIKVVRDGGAMFDPALLRDLLRSLSQASASAPRTLEALSPRELKTLRLVAQGRTNKDIAEQLNYSVGTVKNVIQRIIEKLGVSDRTQAAVLAVRAGLDIDDQLIQR